MIPFLSRSAFERVTGRKTEWWLVLTVSALVGAVGAALAVSVRAKPETETVVLGAGAAAGLGLIDVTYVSRRRASGEQSSAMTPTSQPSEPVSGGAPDFLIWSTGLSLAVLSIVLPAAVGGSWLWLLPAVMLPLIAAWMVMQRLMITRKGQLHVQGHGPVLAIIICTAIAVAVFCAIVAIAFAH